MRLRIATTVLLATALTAGVLTAQDGQGTLMRTLEEPFSLTIDDMPITLALERIAETTGLSIELGEDVLALLPHGEETRLRISARNVKLSSALTAMLSPMALDWRAEGGRIVVVATDPLRRIGRRPTFTEVEILARLHSQSLRRGRAAVEQIRELTGIRDIEFVWHQVPPEVRARAMAAADQALPSTAAAYLDRVCHGRDLTWFVWDTDIMILPTDVQATRQLRRTVTVEYRGRPLDQVIYDLARKADLRLKMDPGVMTVVGAQARENFTLLMERATIEEAFEAISGATGLTFTTEGQALRVGAAEGIAPPPAEARPRAPFLVTTTVTGPDGREYTVIFRPEDLPTDFVERIIRSRDQLLQSLRDPPGTD